MPIISRFRQGNVMIEEKKDEKEFDVIPASSDRNEVVRDNLQTEDVMKWWCSWISYDYLTLRKKIDQILKIKIFKESLEDWTKNKPSADTP